MFQRALQIRRVNAAVISSARYKGVLDRRQITRVQRQHRGGSRAGPHKFIAAFVTQECHIPRKLRMTRHI